jgi:DNA helicase-2/ATP-dependent DNA helicase PcrA
MFQQKSNQQEFFKPRATKQAEPVKSTARWKPLTVENEPATVTQHINIGELHVGSIVSHERFGIGEITALIEEDGNTKASVTFENFGSKQLLLKFARLEIIKNNTAIK